MKVIFIGAQGTGKTSLIQALPEEYREDSIREVIRNMMSDEVKINMESSDETQNKFFFEYLYLFSKYDKYISDRGLIDVCAYTKWLSTIGVCSKYNYEKQMYILKSWLKNNPGVLHIYFPIYFPLVDDGVRDADFNNQKDVDKCLLEVIDELIKEDLWRGYKISDGSVIERVNEILPFLK